MILKILSLWLLFLPIAVMNGIIRESTYKKILGDLPAHQVSTIIAIVLFITLAFTVLGKSIVALETSTLLMYGALLVILTIVFEFCFGHFVDHVSWEKLFADYNIFKGRIWGLFLLTEFFTPWLIKVFHQVR